MTKKIHFSKNFKVTVTRNTNGEVVEVSLEPW